jgi:hypothetical protein
MMTNNIPMFRLASSTTVASDAPALGIVSGLLLLDSGEADNTFVFRCQDRYLTYNTLSGIRSVLFVADEQHWKHYQDLLKGHTARLQVISDKIEISLPPIPIPLAFPLDIETLKIADQSFFARQLSDPDIQNSLLRGELVFNQVSPTCLRLVQEMDALLSKYGLNFGVDLAGLAKVGCAALRWHNKAYYVRRTRHLTNQIPTHVRTVLLSAREFLEIDTWEALHRLARNGDGSDDVNHESDAVYVKSSFDSGGNVASRLTVENFREEGRRLRGEVAQRVLCEDIDERADVDSLRRDIGLAPTLESTDFSDEQLVRFLEAQRSRRNDISILLQAAIDRPASDGHGFEGIGVTCDISPDGIDILPAGQLYGDQERLHYIGSYLGPELSSESIPSNLRNQLLNLCAIAAEEGYRGPINFDARVDPSGNWIFIYDCNPRLSALYPPLATRRWLLEHGLAADTIVSLGYRGEYAGNLTLEEILCELDDRGWLYTSQHPRGALPLPNLARRNGLDLVLINLERREIREFVHVAANLRFDKTACTCVSALY